MKAWELGTLGMENLSLVDRPEPEPGRGKVKLRVRAAALNSRDLQVIYNKYDPNQRLPIVPVSGGVGEIVGVGDGVTRVEARQRLVGYLSQLNLESPEPPAYGYSPGVLTALLDNVRTQGISSAPRESYESMYRAMEASEIRPVVDREYAFEDAVGALTSLRDAGAFGKIVINVG